MIYLSIGAIPLEDLVNTPHQVHFGHIPVGVIEQSFAQDPTSVIASSPGVRIIFGFGESTMQVAPRVYLKPGDYLVWPIRTQLGELYDAPDWRSNNYMCAEILPGSTTSSIPTGLVSTGGFNQWLQKLGFEPKPNQPQ